jgi:hypothetical protein
VVARLRSRRSNLVTPDEPNPRVGQYHLESSLRAYSRRILFVQPTSSVSSLLTLWLPAGPYSSCHVRGTSPTNSSNASMRKSNETICTTQCSGPILISLCLLNGGPTDAGGLYLMSRAGRRLSLFRCRSAAEGWPAAAMLVILPKRQFQYEEVACRADVTSTPSGPCQLPCRSAPRCAAPGFSTGPPTCAAVSSSFRWLR